MKGGNLAGCQKMFPFARDLAIRWLSILVVRSSACFGNAFRITTDLGNAALGRRWPVNVDQPGLRGEPERLL